jgi:mannitol/fructose-specific phosphotransferase system IIA component (Ntr-type)
MPTAYPVNNRINLIDIFLPENVIIGLGKIGKVDLISQMVRRLVETGRIAPQAESAITKTILAREKTGTTALGNGIAFPHCRSNLADTFTGAVAVDCRGVSFDAVDKSLVNVVFLLVGPLSDREQYFDILGRINSIGSHKAMRIQLSGSGSADGVIRLLRKLDAENEFFGTDIARQSAAAR